MSIKKSICAAVAVAAVLTACGGGGSSGSPTAGGTSSNLQSNEVSIGTTALTAGQSTAVFAHAVMRGSTPKAMTWTITPLNAVNAGDPAPTVSDPNCAGATFSPPLIANATGEATCQAVVTAPPGARSGTWRLMSTATSTASSVSNYVDFSVTAIPESGFRLVTSSTPQTGYINKQLTLSVPFTINPGNDVKEISYTWAAATSNPIAVPIAGATNSTATVTPTVAGQYQYDVTVKALINGFSQTAKGSVVATIYPANVTDIIDAGLPQLTTPGQVIKLVGSLTNKSSTANYSYSWTQLAGTAGGPETVTINNANSPTASIVTPTSLGNYGFVFTVTKDNPDGTKNVTQSQTTVIVQAAPSGVFTLNAGAAQTVAVGSTATLAGSVGTQGTVTGVTYQYQWTQVGTSPAVVTLSNAGSQTASFIPTVAGTYTFNLTVKATTASGTTTVSGQTQVVATVGGAASSAPFAMTANSGPAQSVAANAVTTLTGSQTSQGSTSNVNYAYAWTQVGASPAAVVLSNANTSTATFLPTVSGVYTFRLTVTASLPDGTTKTATSDSQVTVGGVGNAFSVSAGNAQTLASGTAAIMTGQVTTQGTWAGATFAYAWTQVGASPAAVTVSNANALIASFVPTVSGTYTFNLTVTATSGGVVTTQTATTQVLVP